MEFLKIEIIKFIIKIKFLSFNLMVSKTIA